jgi:hypothetical protein
LLYVYAERFSGKIIRDGKSYHVDVVEPAVGYRVYSIVKSANKEIKNNKRTNKT